MHIRKNFSKFILQTITIPQKIPSCDNLATSTPEEWGKSEGDPYWPGGVNVVHITIQFLALLLWIFSLHVFPSRCFYAHFLFCVWIAWKWLQGNLKKIIKDLEIHILSLLWEWSK